MTVVLTTLLVLGVIGGLLWVLVVEPAEFTKTAQGGAMGENDLSKRFDADAWFVVIGAGLGLLGGLVLSVWRARDPLLTSALLVLGSVLAAGVMLLVGRVLGPHGTEAALRAATVGTKVPEPLGVDTLTVLLSWPIGSLAGAMFLLLGRPLETVERPTRHDPPSAAG